MSLKHSKKKENISNEAKYITCATLATIFQRTGNFLKARDYAKQYVDNFSPDTMDFSGAAGFLFTSLQANVNYTLMTEGVLPAVNQWESITAQFSDYPSLVMDAFAEGIAVAFAHRENEQGAALCERFIDKYPDSKDSRIFDARLSLIANTFHPKDEVLNPLKDGDIILQRVYNARKEALVLLNDFEGTRLAETVVVFLASHKEMEDICKDIVVQQRDTFGADYVVLPISSDRIVWRVIVVILNLVILFYVFYHFYKKNKSQM